MYNSAEQFPGCGALRFISASCFEICMLQLVSKTSHFNVTSSRSTCSDKLAQNRREEGVVGVGVGVGGGGRGAEPVAFDTYVQCVYSYD